VNVESSIGLKDELVAEITSCASRLPAPALIPILAFVDELARDERFTPATITTVRRSASRWRLMRRFSRLRRNPKHRRRSNHYIVSNLLDRSVDGVTRCRCYSVRTVEALILRYNAIGPDGLAGGLSALIDRYGFPRPLDRRLNGVKTPVKQSRPGR